MKMVLSNENELLASSPEHNVHIQTRSKPEDYDIVISYDTCGNLYKKIKYISHMNLLIL